MTSKELYKRFANLCQKWPTDDTKLGRDYAQYFRQQFANYFPQGEHSQIKNSQMIESQLNALERIAKDAYFNENLLKKSSASGLEAWACKTAVSNEFLKIVKERDDNVLVNKLRRALSMKFAPISRNIK